jgi:hypothetical protein
MGDILGQERLPELLRSDLAKAFSSTSETPENFVEELCTRKNGNQTHWRTFLTENCRMKERSRATKACFSK